MGSRRSLALATAMGVLLALAPPVTAQAVIDLAQPLHESVTLASGEWRAYRTPMGSTDSLRINVQGTAGGRFDVFTTNAFGFAEYTDPNSTVFDYYPDGSAINVTRLGASFAAPTGDLYFVILDNTRITSGGADPVGSVTLDISLEKVSLLPILVGVLLALGAVGVGVPLLLRSRRRVRRSVSPQVPHEGPPEPPAPPGT